MKQLKLKLFLGVFFMNVSLFSQEIKEPICIGEKIAIKSEILNQTREIYISLPENYENDDLKFSTHYVLDGEMTFNCYSSLVELKSQNKEIPPAIVIGIPNIDRNFDFNPKANGSNFLNFITKELIPFIDKNYKTSGIRIIAGYSLAGNFVINTLLNSPDSFNMFLSGSPYRLDIYNVEDIDNLLNLVNTKTSIFTSMGSKDDPKQLELFKTFCDQFEKRNRDLIDYKYEIAINRDHDNNFLINWQDGLDYLFRNWSNDKIIYKKNQP